MAFLDSAARELQPLPGATIFGYASGVTNRQKVSLKLAAKLKVMTRPHSHVALHKQLDGRMGTECGGGVGLSEEFMVGH